MKRVTVTSSNLRSVGFDASTLTLEVEFQGGKTYQFRNVPQQVHDELMSAKSKGEYFYRNIRGQYPYNKIGVEAIEGASPEGSKRTFDEYFPGRGPLEQILYKGTCLIKGEKLVPCDECGRPTFWLVDSFHRYLCSPACFDKVKAANGEYNNAPKSENF